MGMFAYKLPPPVPDHCLQKCYLVLPLLFGVWAVGFRVFGVSQGWDETRVNTATRAARSRTKCSAKVAVNKLRRKETGSPSRRSHNSHQVIGFTHQQGRVATRIQLQDKTGAHWMCSENSAAAGARYA